MKAGKARVIVNPVGAADPGIAAADIRPEGLDEDAGIARPAPDEILESVEVIVRSGAGGQEKGEAVESAKLVETTPERKARGRSEAASGFHSRQPGTLQLPSTHVKPAATPFGSESDIRAATAGMLRAKEKPGNESRAQR
jgi:hypothetical protein